MSIRVAVGDVMTREFASITPKDSLKKAAKEMTKKRVNSLLITTGSKLKGIITARDVLWTITKKSKIDLSTVNVMKVATRKVAVIKPSADISQALEKMKQLNFRRLPVLLKGELVGIITLKDILKIDPSLYSEISHMNEIKEESSKIAKIKSLDYEIDGLCDECDAFSSLLRVGKKNLCADCRDELY
jgi:CBS domain-containing protein